MKYDKMWYRYRLPGFGTLDWRRIISELQIVGYDGTISIEHEDSLMSQNEGLTKAVSVLKDALITESTGDMWWV